MRTDIQVGITCSVCGRDLEADSDKSKMLFGSAYEAFAVFAIKPCKVCYGKLTEPLRLMKQALDSVESNSKE